MSQFIRRLNQIKTKRSIVWLTPSQETTFSNIKSALRVPSTVNLFGRVGVGKTFLGWTLAQGLNFAYLSYPELIASFNSAAYNGVILDNCFEERYAHRELLKELRFQEISRAILITRQMIKDYTQFVELQLTELDVLAVQQNLTSVGMLPNLRDDIPNLWYLINLSL